MKGHGCSGGLVLGRRGGSKGCSSVVPESAIGYASSWCIDGISRCLVLNGTVSHPSPVIVAWASSSLSLAHSLKETTANGRLVRC